MNATGLSCCLGQRRVQAWFWKVLLTWSGSLLGGGGRVVCWMHLEAFIFPHSEAAWFVSRHHLCRHLCHQFCDLLPVAVILQRQLLLHQLGGRKKAEVARETACRLTWKLVIARYRIPREFVSSVASMVLR